MRNKNLSRMIKIALLGAIAAILMYFKFPLPFAPPFMDVDISEVPAIIAGFTFGPLYGVLVVVIKLILKIILQGTTTGGIGELSNLVVSSAFVITASVIYKRKESVKNAVFALIMGIILMSVLAVVSNYFVIFPLYGIPMDTYASQMGKINSLVTDVPTLIAFAIVPFNLIKGILNAIIATTLYRKLEPVLNKK